MFTGLLACLSTALLLLVPLSAAEDGKGSAYVVLVGIDNYPDKQIKPRQHGEADARALYDLFVNKDYLGVDKDRIKLLLGSADEKRGSQPATRENILKALTWAVTNAKRDDLVLFAFFGQGAPLGDRTCFFATDSTFKDRAKNAVAGADIEHVLEKLKSQHFAAFIDVNFKGFDAGKENVAEANPNDLVKVFMGEADREDQTSPAGRVVFLATSGLRQSIDLEKHGLFAKVVMDGLKGGADKEGYEPDGLVTVDELVEYVNKELPALAKKFGKTQEEKLQLHHILGSRTSHFALTHNPKAMPQAQANLAKLAKLAADKKISREVAEEGQKLLSRMPKLKAQQELRKDYQKLVAGTLSVEDFLKARDEIFAAMKLKRSECVEFANKVMAAVNLVRNDYVKELNQGEMVRWAVRGLCQRVDEKQVLTEFSDRLAKVKELKPTELMTLLADVREKLGKREDLDKNKDVDIAVQQMLTHLDPYTNYIDQETKERLRGEITGHFSGIGIQIRKDATTDYILVVTPIKGSPAYRAGIKTGDIITTVTREVDSDGTPLEKPETFSTKDLPLGEAVKKILGKAGTKVKLTIERPGEKKPLEFEITRGNVEVESVLGFKRKDNDDWDFVLDPANRIIYVRLTNFARNTYEALERVLAEADKQGIRGLILDLRFNPGGLLQSATDICDLFIDDGLIVSIRPRVGRELATYGKSEGSYLNFPMVVLINGGSASGSEIVAGCLQDHRRAIIIGERSYGKGSVQNIQRFKQTGGEIKLTTATFWRPSGKNINKSSTKGSDDEEWGISPDKGYLLKLTPKERDELFDHLRDTEIIARRDAPSKEVKPEFKDKQLEMALEYLRKQIKTVARQPAPKAG
jgi:C-terminal peptidase prc